MKLINVVLTGGEARSNPRAGARVITRIGTLLEMSENGQDDDPEVQFDAVFISGKDKIPFGRIRSEHTLPKMNVNQRMLDEPAE